MLYSKWGTTSGTGGSFGTGGYASEGGFEEWKVRKAPNLTIVKTADAATVNAGQNIGFTIMITVNGAADATGVTINDPLPLGPGLDWSEAPDNANCSISGVAPRRRRSTVARSRWRPVVARCRCTQKPTTALKLRHVQQHSHLHLDQRGVRLGRRHGHRQLWRASDPEEQRQGGAVANAGAVFSVDGPDANTDPDFTVTDDTTAAAPDEAADAGGRVTGLAPDIPSPRPRRQAATRSIPAQRLPLWSGKHLRQPGHRDGDIRGSAALRHPGQLPRRRLGRDQSDVDQLHGHRWHGQHHRGHRLG